MNATHILHDVDGTCTSCQAMEMEVVRLRTELQEAHHDPIWGIGTRQAMERRLTMLIGCQGAIVLDIDDMHGANERWGHAGVDRRIGQIMQHVRQADTFAGRWLRGDEIVLFCDTANMGNLAIRLLVLFEMYGLGATITTTVATREGIAAGIERIERAKHEGRRGQVLT